MNTGHTSIELRSSRRTVKTVHAKFNEAAISTLNNIESSFSAEEGFWKSDYKLNLDYDFEKSSGEEPDESEIFPSYF